DVDRAAAGERAAEMAVHDLPQHREAGVVDAVERAVVVGRRDLAARQGEAVEPGLVEDALFDGAHASRPGMQTAILAVAPVRRHPPSAPAAGARRVARARAPCGSA